jgi:hypothetical protein
VETLRALRDHLSSVETDIGRSILSVEKGLSSLEGDGDVEGEAEREAARSEDEDVYRSYNEEERDERGPSSRAVPRRASMAVDTMGEPLYLDLESEDVWDNEDEGEPVSLIPERASQPGFHYESRS